MGEVRARLILENQADRVLSDAGYLDGARVRRAELDVLGDTGAVMTLLPQNVVEALGLPLCEPLLGQLVLERLDLIVDPIKHAISPRPESPFVPSLKLK